jgi:hypothetical protein
VRESRAGESRAAQDSGCDFRWLYTGRFVASAGDVVATTAANWQVLSSLYLAQVNTAPALGNTEAGSR